MIDNLSPIVPSVSLVCLYGLICPTNQMSGIGKMLKVFAEQTLGSYFPNSLKLWGVEINNVISTSNAGSI